jgi:hypothetical protein
VKQHRDGPTLAALSKLYIEEGNRGGTWREVSTHEVERSLRDLFDLMGDMPVEAFDVQQARLLKDRLGRCPQYFGLRSEFEGKTLKQVVESGAVHKTITAVTVNNRLRKLSAFMNWCKSNGYVADNPLAGLKVMTGSAKDARLSFDRQDLTILLNLDALRAEARKYPWRYWLPLLGRATGARLEELCQLRVDDFVEQQSIQCIRIDVLIVTKLDRLGRNAMDVRQTVEHLAASGIRVHCLALGGVDLTSAAGKMTMQVLSAVAEFERDLLIERTQSGLKRAKAEGKKLGRPEAAGTTKAVQKFKAPDMTQAQVAGELKIGIATVKRHWNKV